MLFKIFPAGVDRHESARSSAWWGERSPGLPPPGWLVPCGRGGIPR